MESSSFFSNDSEPSSLSSKSRAVLKIAEASPITPEVREAVKRLLEIMHVIEVEDAWVLEGPGVRLGGFQSTAESMLARLADDLLLGLEAPALEHARKLNRELRTQLRTSESSSNKKEGLDVDLYLHLVEQNDSMLALLEDRTAFRERADRLVNEAEQTAERVQESASKAEQSASAAQQAAGVAGEVALSEHFATYASNELRTANWFRGFAIAGIIAALAVAAFAPHPPSNDWVALSYRVAQLAGIAALATYFGRQAAQHRRVHNWAKGLQVQLQSFPAFIAPIDEQSTRDEIYSAFARRVLGAPPEKAGSSSDEAYPTQQLVELATTVVKKAQSQ